MILQNIAIRRKGLYALSFDEAVQVPFAEVESEKVLLIDRDTFDTMSIHTGDDVLPDRLEELVHTSACNRAYSKALWLLNYRDCTKKAMAEKLSRDFPDFAAQYAAERCVQYHIIDDQRYAERYAEILMVNKQVPKKQAMYKLMEKGVPRPIAETVVEDVPVDTAEQLKNLIQKKYALRLQDEASIQKVTAALMRKGFSYSQIQSAIAAFTEYEGE